MPFVLLSKVSKIQEMVSLFSQCGKRYFGLVPDESIGTIWLSFNSRQPFYEQMRKPQKANLALANSIIYPNFLISGYISSGLLTQNNTN
jgi:hypothetical protein